MAEATSIIQRPIIFERANNELWPLPPDYLSLNGDKAKLQARLNASQIGMGDSSGMSEAQAALYRKWGWWWFCRYYLMPDKRMGFNPMFYKPPALEFGVLHHRLVESWEGDPLSAWACPRGSGKSTTIRSYLTWKLCTTQQHEINLFKLNMGMGREDIQRIREQLDQNTRILADYGELAPKHGTGPWHTEVLQTKLRSWLRVFGVESGKRGPRANLTLGDDLEQDPKKGTASDEKRRELIEMIERVLIPMLDEGCRMSIVGTLVHHMSFLYHVVSPEDGDQELDPIFKKWTRHNVKWGDAKGRNAWSAKFTPSFIEGKKATMTRIAFAREYENLPGLDEDSVLAFDQRAHTYVRIGEPKDDAPFESNDMQIQYVNYIEKGLTENVTKPYNEWLTGLYRFATVDYAYTTNRSSDWSVVHVFGLDTNNDLFTLEMWRDKVDFTLLVDKIIEMGYKWRCELIATEAYPIQEQYINQIAARFDKLETAGHSPPTLLPITPHQMMSKGQKIMRVKWRLDRAKWKMPSDLIDQDCYKHLVHQVMFFTEDLRALKKDDELDTLQMTVDVVRSSVAQSVTQRPKELYELYLDGESVDPDTGIPIRRCLDIHNTPSHVIGKIMGAKRVAQYEQSVERARLPWADESGDFQAVREADIIDPY